MCVRAGERSFRWVQCYDCFTFGVLKAEYQTGLCSPKLPWYGSALLSCAARQLGWAGCWRWGWLEEKVGLQLP